MKGRTKALPKVRIQQQVIGNFRKESLTQRKMLSRTWNAVKKPVLLKLFESRDHHNRLSNILSLMDEFEIEVCV